ncbi:MAG: signal peptide peptidase SppA [Proteobacteria bacterium]|nr:signal peptide peptidase SppA [Pseudomonadota bacterium]
MFIEQRRKENAFLTRMLLFFKRFFVVMGVAATITFVMLFMTLHKLINYAPPSLPESMVLTYTFKSGLVEKVTKPSLTQPLLRPATTFHEIIEDLTQASKDPRVKGFAARLQDIDMTPAQLQELRDTISTFRKSGKCATVFAEDFGGFGSGMGDYYLASSFGQIWLQPVGAISINGISAEVPFLKGIMDKIGIEAQFGHKGIYKSTPESLTETGMSAPHREMMTSLVNDLANQIMTGISTDRKIPMNSLHDIVNHAPYNDEEALRLKLVDKIGYYDQMLDDAKARAKANGITPELVGLQGYSFTSSTTDLDLGITGFISKFFHKADPAYATRNKAKIALIFGAGDIVSYTASAHAGFGDSGMSADKIVAAFEEAEKDNDVVAVVFRVDSPGGAPSAAEAIRRSILKMQKKGRPVIVSMGGYAASGGYWVATPADKIVAQPATITGSIGVFGGKFVLAALWEKLGIHWESVSVGDNALMWSLNSKFSDPEKERFDALLNNIYESFITRVMQGRNMTRKQVLTVAEGRVWTGRQAQKNGLVDELGGLDKAIALAKTAARLSPGQEVAVERFPPPKSTMELFIQLATEGVSIVPEVKISLGDILHQLKESPTPPTDVLKVPEVRLY